MSFLLRNNTGDVRADVRSSHLCPPSNQLPVPTHAEKNLPVNYPSFGVVDVADVCYLELQEVSSLYVRLV